MHIERIKAVKKKKKFIETLYERSESFQNFTNIMKYIVLGLIIYVLGVIEGVLMHGTRNDCLLAGLIMFFFNLIIVETLYTFITCIPNIKTRCCDKIRYAITVKRYCKIPLTIEEMKKINIKSIHDYFKYINSMLTFYSENENKWRYIKLEKTDLQVILKNSLLVCEDDNTAFALTKNECVACPKEFRKYITMYHEKKVESESEKWNKTTEKIELEFTTKNNTYKLSI